MSYSLIIILDESGSMASMAQQALKSVNQFIEDQRSHSELLDDKNTTLTMWKFSDTPTRVYQNKPLSEVPKFSDFLPMGATALYDAIGDAITHHVETECKKPVVCMILTDGEENMSLRFTHKDVTKLIKECEEQREWRFVYMGANQNSFQVGQDLGLSPKTPCCDFNKDTLASLTRSISGAIKEHRSGDRSSLEKVSDSVPPILAESPRVPSLDFLSPTRVRRHRTNPPADDPRPAKK